MTFKFKVGDKVKVIKKYIDCVTFNWTNYMDNMIGDVCEIKEITYSPLGFKRYLLYDNIFKNYYYWFPEESLSNLEIKINILLEKYL